MTKSHHLILSLLLLLCWSCNDKVESAADEAYRQAIEAWRADRFAALKAADGWPTLRGLFRLKEGANTFGSHPDNDLVFPEQAPLYLGTITLEEDSITTLITDGITVKTGDSLVTRFTSSTSEAKLFEHEAFQWYAIERGGQYFLRLRDTLHPARRKLSPLPYFRLDPHWRVRATFIPFDPPQNILVRNVLDMDIGQESEGKYRFNREGQELELWVLDGGPDEFFVIFADETTGRETYGGGRYLYVPRPDSTGHAILDFNKAYNPPCVFTSYATCLLPPAQNRLPVAVQAGEKMYGLQHH